MGGGRGFAQVSLRRMEGCVKEAGGFVLPAGKVQPWAAEKQVSPTDSAGEELPACHCLWLAVSPALYTHFALLMFSSHLPSKMTFN